MKNLLVKVKDDQHEYYEQSEKFAIIGTHMDMFLFTLAGIEFKVLHFFQINCLHIPNSLRVGNCNTYWRIAVVSCPFWRASTKIRRGAIATVSTAIAALAARSDSSACVIPKTLHTFRYGTISPNIACDRVVRWKEWKPFDLNVDCVHY